jgi:hypothetical protein
MATFKGSSSSSRKKNLSTRKFLFRTRNFLFCQQIIIFTLKKKTFTENATSGDMYSSVVATQSDTARKFFFFFLLHSLYNTPLCDRVLRTLFFQKPYLVYTVGFRVRIIRSYSYVHTIRVRFSHSIRAIGCSPTSASCFVKTDFFCPHVFCL